MEWLPIESAPSGKAVLAYWRPAFGGEYCIAVAVCSHGMWHDPQDFEDDFKEPDAWMLLPAPPTDRRTPEQPE